MIPDFIGFDVLMGNNKINPKDIFSFVNKKIIMSRWDDTISTTWVHSLTSDREFLCLLENQYLIFYSKKFDLYFFYSLDIEFNDTDFKNKILKLTKNNFVHILISHSTFCYELIEFLSEVDIKNLKHSLLFPTADPFLDTRPFNLKLYKKLSYIFSSTNIVKDLNVWDGITWFGDTWLENNINKIYIDHKYSLAYYYFKFGLNFIQKGENLIEISNKKDKVFLYSKINSKSNRYIAINMALNSNKIYEKVFSKEDIFFDYRNADNYHTPFIIDYNICKFNLIMETNQPSNDDNEKDYEKENIFLSEKTLKGLMVDTPCYILLKPQTYKTLKEYGFYLLNSEFEDGEYDFSNYERFCQWLKNCTDIEFNEMFERAFEKSRKNKELVETYIYSDKEKEINLLINS
jgi:hypothetical protein